MKTQACISCQPHDCGSDIDDSDQEGEEVEADPRQAATVLWHQFLQDITVTSPNYKDTARSSYTVLTNTQCKAVTEKTYENPTLSDYFRDCQWKYATDEEWDSCFNQLFPPQHAKKRHPKAQNYFRTIYYGKWEDLKMRTNLQTYKEMRRVIKIRFDTLYWMPFAVRDRIWWTKKHDGMVKMSGIPHDAPSLRILVNSSINNPPRW
jgi:hypothetical protein